MLAIRFAREPNVTSVMILGMGLTTLAMAPPIVTPAATGHPNTMDKGIRASATLIWTSSKLILDKVTTRTAYKLAKIAVNAMSLVPSFNFPPPTPGFIMAERVEVHSPANNCYAHHSRLLNVTENYLLGMPTSLVSFSGWA